MRREFTLSLKKAALIAAAILIAAFSSGFELASWHGTKSSDQLDSAGLAQIYQVLKQKYDGKIDVTKLAAGAKQGLTAATGDPYTEYLTAAEAKDLNDDLNGTLSGIGAEIGIKSGQLIIISPLANSPAAKVGLKAGDQILKIDSTDASTLTLGQAVSHIRGPKGTAVKLTIVRAATTPQVLMIMRDVIQVPSVTWSMKSGNVGLITISQFGPDTVDLADRAATELRSKGARGIILDLRNDPGGFLDAAVKVASEFLPGGKLVVEERRGSTSVAKLNSESGGKLIGLTTVVLINSGSASASEILAGALHDNRVAKLIGERSFGKGSVQEIVDLDGGAELKVTVAHWYTPAGKNIGNAGINPDTTVKMDQSDIDQGKDPQMDAALTAASPK